MTEPGGTRTAGREKKVHFRRTRATLSKIPHPPLRSKMGMLLAFVVIAGIGSVLTLAAYIAVSYSETAAFCGTCHQMDAELKAFSMSPHSELTCADCHVEPGIGGFIKAKVNGTKQLFQVITKTYPQPIPPPDHSLLPSITDTCLKCHSLQSITANGGPTKMVLRPRYLEDKKNTQQMVAVVVRPSGLKGDTASQGINSKGVHWHAEVDIKFVPGDEQAQTIKYVSVTEKDGSVEQYISGSSIGSPQHVTPDVDRVVSAGPVKTMLCTDCHNRVGHGAPSPSQAVDSAMTTGKIDSSLPYIKKYTVEALNGSYDTVDEANAAIESIRTHYPITNTPASQKQAIAVDDAIEATKVIYAELATPEMKVEAATYPTNIGHQSSPGCFRCHDGSHYKVVNGKATQETIPSACSTCHTFPQIGDSVSGILIGNRPATHASPLYVFSHATASQAISALRNTNFTVAAHGTAAKVPVSAHATSVGQPCETCHGRAYCEDCHKSGAIKIDHDQMMFNHAESARVSGTAACAYCHAESYCATCHKQPMLDPADHGEQAAANAAPKR